MTVCQGFLNDLRQLKFFPWFTCLLANVQFVLLIQPTFCDDQSDGHGTEDLALCDWRHIGIFANSTTVSRSVRESNRYLPHHNLLLEERSTGLNTYSEPQIEVLPPVRKQTLHAIHSDRSRVGTYFWSKRISRLWLGSLTDEA